VPREQIWITTKLDNPWHKRVEEGLRTSCENLGVEYVDLYLMVSFGRRRRTGG
jgi:glycerol 2-dehydrogenase (NADP+)